MYMYIKICNHIYIYIYKCTYTYILYHIISYYKCILFYPRFWLLQDNPPAASECWGKATSHLCCCPHVVPHRRRDPRPLHPAWHRNRGASPWKKQFWLANGNRCLLGFLIFLIHDFHVLVFFFCGANSIFHWIYTHSHFWWSCKVEKESLMCDSWKGVYCTPSTGYACLKTICWKRQRSPKQAYLLYIISQYLVMSHFNLYLWLKQLKVGGHICKPPMPQIMVIRHRQWTSRKWASFH